MGSGLQIFAREDRVYDLHIMGCAVVAVGLGAQAIAFLERFVRDLFAQFDNGIKNGFRTWGQPGI